jgi:hypothetical protein
MVEESNSSINRNYWPPSGGEMATWGMIIILLHGAPFLLSATPANVWPVSTIAKTCMGFLIIDGVFGVAAYRHYNLRKRLGNRRKATVLAFLREFLLQCIISTAVASLILVILLCFANASRLLLVIAVGNGIVLGDLAVRAIQNRMKVIR